MLVTSGAMLTFFSAGFLGLLTQLLVKDLSPTGIGPITAACAYLFGAIFLTLSLGSIRSGIWQIRNRRRDVHRADQVMLMIPWILGLGVVAPLFNLLFGL